MKLWGPSGKRIRPSAHLRSWLRRVSIVGPA